MARIGRQVDHFSEVDIQGIRADFSPDRIFRYTLEMSYRKNLVDGGRNKVMTVILKNPSSADEKRADSTIRKVETFVWNRFPDAGFLNILNIFAFRATDASEVNKRMREMDSLEVAGPQNDAFFEKTLAGSDYVICAWGGPSGIDPAGYADRIFAVKSLLGKHFSGPVYQVCGSQPTREPLHGLMWGYDYTLKPFEL